MGDSAIRTKAKAVLVAFLSAGWLIPLWLAVGAYSSFWQYEVWPVLLGKLPINSFPHMEFAEALAKASLAWLALVLLFWSYVGFSLVASSRAA